METITIRELQKSDPKEFERLYYKWQETATDYDWYQYTYDYFTEQGAEKGIYPEKWQFSGFWSQGDGAAFTGKVRVAEFMKATGMDTKFPALYLDMDDYGAYMIVLCSGRYMGMRGQFEWSSGNTRPSGVFAGLSQEAWDELIDFQFGESDLEGEMLRACEELASECYLTLEDDYTYLTSEEQFIEDMEDR